MAQEPNRNREPEPSEPFKKIFAGTERGTGTAGTVFQEPKPCLSFLTELKQRKTFFAEEPPEPKTRTAQTVPPPNRNRTEPNRGLPALKVIFNLEMLLSAPKLLLNLFWKGRVQ